MHVLDANEIFGMTFYTYDRILEEGGKIGPDALALYVKLIKQTRIQQTNQTKSLDAFLEKGLGRGYKRLKNAKEVLNKLGLMDNVVVRDELGKVVGHYVRVNFLINEQKVRTSGITYNLSTTYSEADVAENQMWLDEHKCLNNININAGSNKTQKETKSSSLNNSLNVRLTNICKGNLTFSKEVIERLEEYNHTRSKKLEKLKDKGFKLVIDKLIKYGKGTEEGMIAVLKQSIENGWEGLFEVKGLKPKMDYENNLGLFLNKMKTNYEGLKQELGKEKFFELKKKALEYGAENKLL